MKGSYVRVLATLLAIPFVAFACFQLVTIYFNVNELWMQGISWWQFEAYAWLAGAVGVLATIAVSYGTRPKKDQTEPEEDPVKQKNIQTLFQYASEEEKRRLVQEHPELFGLPQKKAGLAEPPIFRHSSSSPLSEPTALATPPNMETATEFKGSPFRKSEHNGGDFDNQVRNFLINQLKLGNTEAEITIQQEENGGGFRITEPIKIRISTPQQHKDVETKTGKVDSKQSRRDPVIPALPKTGEIDVSPTRSVNGVAKNESA